MVLPKGSLEKATLELFDAADLSVKRSSSVDYKATIDDRAFQCAPAAAGDPVYVAEGLFDIGITGRDWIAETDSDVVSLGELQYSKATRDPIKLVVAVAGDSEITDVAQFPDGVRVTSEYPELTRRYFAGRGVNAEVRLSYGASEAKIPDIADCVVEITETGRALRAAGLKVIDTIMHSYTEVIANQGRRRRSGQAPCDGPTDDAAQRRAGGATRCWKLNVVADRYDAVLAVLPAAKSPTVAQLANGGFAVETVVDKRQIT